MSFKLSGEAEMKCKKGQHGILGLSLHSYDII